MTGLSAAWEALGRGATVAVVEPDEPGGKVRASTFDGGVLDEAADAFLARVPEGVELCRELGLQGTLVSPAQRRAHVFSQGALRMLPAGQLLGVPTDLDELAASGIVSPAGVEIARADHRTALVAPEGDVPIGALVRARLGDEVHERLVDPLVGSINAGDTDRLSLAATAPQLDMAARSGAPGLMAACARLRTPAGGGGAAPDGRPEGDEAPVFFAPRGGMGSLAATLANAVADGGGCFVHGAARALERDSGGRNWRVEVASNAGRSALDADGVVLAAPAPASASLLDGHCPVASGVLGGLHYVSVVMVSLALARHHVERDLDASGLLVPRVEGRLVTACSWVSSKWAHLQPDPETVWLRASAGRDGDDRATSLDDEALVDAVLADLAGLMEVRGVPRAVRVSRWPSSFPQYRPGHLDRVATVETAVEPLGRLAVAGAGMRGLGVPACIAQGRAAARRCLT